VIWFQFQKNVLGELLAHARLFLLRTFSSPKEEIQESVLCRMQKNIENMPKNAGE
jgi:hypothetical protein